MLLYWWLVVFTVCLIPTAVGALGQNFYIAPWGSNKPNCTNQNDPCQTLQHVFSVMGGGDTLILRGGEYNDGGLSSKFSNIPSGPNPSQRTTVMGMQGETPIMHQGVGFFTYNSGPEAFRNIQIGPGIIFDGNRAGINFGGGQVNNLRVIGVEIRNTGSESCIDFHDGGINDGPLGWPTGIEFIDNHVHHCGEAGGQHGVYACAPGTIWRGNHIHHGGSYAMQWYSSAPYGTEHCGDNTEIYNNYFHDSQQGQYLTGDCHDCASEVTLNHGNNIKFYNNVIVAAGQFGGGVELGRGSTNGHIYNNTIITPSGNSAVGLGDVNGVTIRNNIMFGSSNGIGYRNDSFNVVESNNSGQNPKFQACGLPNNPTDAYCIASDSPMHDAGRDLSSQGFNTDYAGRLRGQGAGWDIGAYEYVEGPQTCPPNCPVTCPPDCPITCPPDCPTGSGNTYYADVQSLGGTCSNSNNTPNRIDLPVCSINVGLQRLASGDTLFIRGGTYPEKVKVDGNNVPNGVSAAQPTTISGYQNETVIITGDGSGTAGFQINADQARDFKFFLIKKFTLDGNNQGPQGANNLFASGYRLSDIVFEDIEIRNVYGNGINGFQFKRITFRRIYSHHNGGFRGHGIYVLGENTIIEDSEFHDNQGYGIQFYDNSCPGASPVCGDNSVIRNNKVHHNAVDPVNCGCGGIVVSYSHNVQVYNNLVYNDGLLIPGGSNGIEIQYGAARPLVNVEVYNNTIYGHPRGAAIYVGPDANGTKVYNNIVYNNAAGIDNQGSGTLQGNNLATDPLFVNAASNDFRLQAASPAHDGGVSLSTIFNTDIVGEHRGQGTGWDIGAYEYVEGMTPCPPNCPTVCPPNCPTGPSPGSLSVSPNNGRYFVNPAGQIVYLTGAYSWNFASDMPDAERAAYLNYVVSHNQNLIRIPSQDYSGTAQSTNYLSVLASRINEAAALGIYVQVAILPSTDPPFNSHSFNAAYARSVVAAVARYSNVIFETGNELDTQTIDAGTPGSFVANLVAIINNEQAAQGINPRRMTGISDFRPLGSWSDSPATITFMLNSQADFIVPAWSENGSNNCDLPDYGGQKVIISETDHLYPYHCDHTWAWKAFTLGLNPSLLDGNAFFPDHSEPDNPSDTVGAAMTFDAKVRMGDTRIYALKMNLAQAIPHPELSSTGYALAWPGHEYLVYQPGTGSFTVNMQAGNYTAEWFDPTAQTTSSSIATVAVGGNNTFSTPLNASHDAVLLLKVGTTPPVGTMNPIYVAQTGGMATTDCVEAENPATPIRTIAGGLACMNVSPGKIMYVKSGTYTECIDTLTQPIKGGNGPGYTDATIIQSFGNDLVTIKPTACPSGVEVAVFLRNGANDKFIVFRGSDPAAGGNRLVIDGSAIPNNIALYPSGHHIRFEFVDIKGSSAYEAFFAYNVSNIDLVDSLVHGAVSGGIAFVGTVTSPLIERTQIYSNGTTTNSRGIDTAGSGTTTTGLTVSRSNIHDNGGDGLFLGTSTGASVLNSLFVDNGGKGVWIGTGASGTKLHSNTFYSNTGVGVQCDSGATSVDIMNNIFTGNASPNFVNNCTATTLSNTVTATFVAPPNDLRLANGDPAINAGTNEPTLLVDYAGLPRQQDQQDIGAHERTQAPPNNPDVTLYTSFPYQAMMLF